MNIDGKTTAPRPEAVRPRRQHAADADDQQVGVATLQGTTIYLSDDAAQGAQRRFKTNALAGGVKVMIGTAIIKATGK